MTSSEFGAVDIDVLADYIGDALESPERERVADLIADDPEWRSAYALLAPGMTAVQAELAAFGAAPEPMPADLAVRLDEALTGSAGHSPIAEPTLIDPELAEPTEPHLAPVRGSAGERHLVAVPGGGDEREHTPRRRRLRWAGPIAAAAGVIAFAGFGSAYLNNASSDDTQANSSAAGAAEQAAPAMDSASGGLVSQITSDQLLASGVNYSARNLGAESGQTAMRYSSPEAASANKDDAAPRSSPGTLAAPLAATDLGDPALARLRAPDALMACLAEIARQHGAGAIAVQTVDYARFAGTPALVVRFTAADVEWVYASGPDCGSPTFGAQVRERARVG